MPRPSTGECSEASFITAAEDHDPPPNHPPTYSELSTSLENAQEKISFLEFSLQSSLSESEVKAKEIDIYETAVVNLEVEIEELQGRVRRRDATIAELKRRVEDRCEKVDASLVWERPCLNRVCTHPDNDEHTETAVRKAMGREWPMEPSLKRSTTVRGRLSAIQADSEVSDLFLGEPLVAVPENAAALPKATPMSLGYFQRPEYVAHVKEELKFIIDTFQKHGRDTLKEEIEIFNDSLCEKAKKDLSGSRVDELGGGSDTEAIQKARERYESYAPKWENLDSMMKPILHLGGLRNYRPAVAGALDGEDPAFSLGNPIMPIPINLIVDELLDKVEKDGKLLAGTRRYTRAAEKYREEREEARKRHGDEIQRLKNQIGVLQASQELQKQEKVLEGLRKDNRKLRGEGN